MNIIPVHRSSEGRSFSSETKEQRETRTMKVLHKDKSRISE